MTRALEHVSALIWEENKVHTEIENKSFALLLRN